MQILKRYLTPTEEQQFFSAIKSRSGFAARRDYHMLRLMRLTGGRVGAVCQLTVGDARQALVAGDLTFRDEISKGQRGYEVPVTRAIEAELKGLLKLRRDEGLGLDPQQPLLISRTRSRGGEGLTPRAVQARCKYWSAVAGLRINATPHMLRHTLGKRVVERSTGKEPLLHAAALLGHRDLRSTMVYTRPSREDVARTLTEASL